MTTYARDSSNTPRQRIRYRLDEMQIGTSREEKLSPRIVLIHPHLDCIKERRRLLYLVYDNSLPVATFNKPIRITNSRNARLLVVKRETPGLWKVNGIRQCSLATLAHTRQIHDPASPEG